MYMNSQNANQYRPNQPLVLGMILLVLGLFVAIGAALIFRGDTSSYQVGDLGLVIAGVSIQLLGLGLIIIGKK